MQVIKQITRAVLLLVAISIVVRIAVPNLGFAETLKTADHIAVQKVTRIGDARSRFAAKQMVAGWLKGLDQGILCWVNSFVAGHPTQHKIIAGMGSNEFFRGLPIFFLISVLWFSARIDEERRSRMLAGLMATCVLTLFSVYLQSHLFWHLRPLLNSGLHLTVNPEEASSWIGYHGNNSFPSDTMTLYWGLAAVVFLERRRWGVLAFLWTILIIAIPRVYTGVHYPSDIVASAMLGSLTWFVGAYLSPAKTVAKKIVHVLSPWPGMLDTSFAVIMADMFNLFEGTRHILNGMVSVLKM
ncbi:MAG TPA: phosphatase PAP2 family protein [Terriglobales bacterium]|nr:phosphatase PAP2 family protein [Terriglobales bacterium]